MVGYLAGQDGAIKWNAILMSRNAQMCSMTNEEPCQPLTLQNVKLLEVLTYDESKTTEGSIMFSFGK